MCDCFHPYFYLAWFLQLCPDGLEIFEGMRRQVNLPKQYTAAQLKSDMLTYLNKNSDYFTVSCIIVIKLYVITAKNITSTAMMPKL